MASYDGLICCEFFDDGKQPQTLMTFAMDMNYSTFTIQTSNDAVFIQRAIFFIAGLVCVDDLVNQTYYMHASLAVKLLLDYVRVCLKSLVRDAAQ